MTFGWVAGEPMLLNGPASPLEATTVIPAATAVSSNCLIASADVSGSGSAPNDSLITFTGCTVVAKLIAFRKFEVVVSLIALNTSSPTRLAPGATPSIRMLHAAGRGAAPQILALVTVHTCTGH